MLALTTIVLPVLNVDVLLPWVTDESHGADRTVWWANLLLVLAINLTVVSGVAAALRSMSRGWAFIGLSRLTRAELAALAIIVAAALLAVVVAPSNGQSSALKLGPHSPAEFRAFVGVQLSVAGLQEVFFRGYPIELLRTALHRTWIGVVVSSISFGYYHGGLGDPYATVGSAILGALLAGLYLRTKSLWWPLLIHVGFDLYVATGGLGY